MKPADLKVGEIYRFISGKYKGAPVKLLALTSHPNESRHNARWRITAGPHSGNSKIEEQFVFARTVTKT